MLNPQYAGLPAWERLRDLAGVSVRLAEIEPVPVHAICEGCDDHVGDCGSTPNECYDRLPDEAKGWLRR